MRSDLTFTESALPLTADVVGFLYPVPSFQRWLGLAPRLIDDDVDAALYLAGVDMKCLEDPPLLRRHILTWHAEPQGSSIRSLVPGATLTLLDAELSSFLSDRRWEQVLAEHFVEAVTIDHAEPPAPAVDPRPHERHPMHLPRARDAVMMAMADGRVRLPLAVDSVRLSQRGGALLEWAVSEVVADPELRNRIVECLRDGTAGPLPWLPRDFVAELDELAARRVEMLGSDGGDPTTARRGRAR